jgi:hypothetical protein
MGDEVFPFRMKVRPIATFLEPLEFKPLIPDLKFITNKTMWSGHLRIAMREIPEEDYRLHPQAGRRIVASTTFLDAFRTDLTGLAISRSVSKCLEFPGKCSKSSSEHPLSIGWWPGR